MRPFMLNGCILLSAGRPAAILSVSGQELHPSQPCQIRQFPPDGGPGEAEATGNAPNSIPILTRTVEPITESKKMEFSRTTPQVLDAVGSIKINYLIDHYSYYNLT